MSRENDRRQKITQGLAVGALLACAGLAVGDMLRQLRKRSSFASKAV
jgi:hypothetical protein